MTVTLRTPDSRFDGLTDWPYAPHYADDLPGYAGLRAHWIDEGPQNAPHTFLCLHGEPTWAYLYRRMIPVFLSTGARVVAPDFFGFGRSDKPADDSDYSFSFHRNHLLRLTERLNLDQVTLVVQDWGGLLGLTLPMDPGFRSRLHRLIVMNTALATGVPLTEGFIQWREFVRATPDLPVGHVLRQMTPHLTPAEVAAYDAPFPDAGFKAGVRSFPQLVMTEPNMEGAELSRSAQTFWSQDWNGPVFMAWGEADPGLGSLMDRLRTTIRGCPAPMVLAEGGHFLPEWGEPIARRALQTFGDLPAVLHVRASHC